MRANEGEREREREREREKGGEGRDSGTESERIKKGSRKPSRAIVPG